jgi:methionyl-tRNA formyltransferase
MCQLNIIIVTQDDPLYVPYFFTEFAHIFHDDQIKLHGIVIQAPLGKKNLGALARQMYSFYGPKDFLRVGTRYAYGKVMNALAVRVFRGRFPGHFSLQHVFLKKKLPVLALDDVNSVAFVELLEELKIDLVVSVAASQKVKRATLETPRYGIINVHNAKLPKNRGMLPNFWSLYHYDREPMSAMTVHRMNEALDDGAIVLQEEFRLDPNRSLHDLIIETKKKNAHLVLKALQLYKEGPPPLRPNDRTQATYNTFPNKEDVKAFRAKGLRLL